MVPLRKFSRSLFCTGLLQRCVLLCELTTVGRWGARAATSRASRASPPPSARQPHTPPAALCGYYGSVSAHAACQKTGVENYNWYALVSPAYPSWLVAHLPGWNLTPARGLCTSSSGGGDEYETEEIKDLHWSEIVTPEFVQLVDGGQLQLFDVREPAELMETGRIPGAVNVPLGELEDALELSSEDFLQKYRAPKPCQTDTNIVFHCLAGIRSHSAMETAHLLGYSKARHYIGGWLGWEEHLLALGKK